MIQNVFIVSKSGGLIYHYDGETSTSTVERTFSFPLELILQPDPPRPVVVFGRSQGVGVGQALVAVDGVSVASATTLSNGQVIQSILEDSSKYPLKLTFGFPRTTTNEKIVLASTFFSLFALAAQNSPTSTKSSGILELETSVFRLCCKQTMTGVKFLVVADCKQNGVEVLLERIYEIYADYALKNPFYSLEMPIRADLFDKNINTAIEHIERTGFL